MVVQQRGMVSTTLAPGQEVELLDILGLVPFGFVAGELFEFKWIVEVRRLERLRRMVHSFSVRTGGALEGPELSVEEPTCPNEED